MTHPDLAMLYNRGMECQVNVAKGNGNRIEGDFKGTKWSGYTDGTTTWKSFRIPYNAMHEPTYEDSPITFNLAEHTEGIGMTGWDWEHKVSKWVAFDFDAITGHSDKHQSKLDSEQMQKVRDVACEIPWVSVRRSTSGQGLHLYVMLNDVPTNNHTEHAALARSILAHMSALSGFDFKSKVDICGGNMWVWHRKMKDTPGLKLLQKGSTLEEVPMNWRDHMDVVTSKSRKIRHNLPDDGVIPEIHDKFDRLSGQQNRIPLEEEHKKLIKWFGEEGLYFWWDADRHMLVTHTAHLKKAHEDLKLRGLFDTESDGHNPNEQNCFAFPMRRGSWGVRRFSMGTREHKTWEQDGQGWTRCVFNREPSLKTACLSKEGVEDPSGGFVFTYGTEAREVLEMIGSNQEIPQCLEQRQTTIKLHKDGVRIVVEIEKKTTDGDVPGWMYKGRKWLAVSDVTLPTNEAQIDSTDYDEVLRHLVDPNRSDAGWVINSDGVWVEEPLSHVKTALKYLGLKDNESNQILGGNIFRPWRLVKIPFQSEYPGDRQWNRRAPQFQYAPTQTEDLHFPTWRSVLEHVGQGLNEEVKSCSWAVDNGVLTGYDYLRCWIASMFQEPLEPLPYLFIYGDAQNTGKSTFHEALSLLFRPGYVRADQALMNPQFNGELEGSILCVVEETDLSKASTAYNRIKDWVTARELPIHVKMKTPYHVPNTTHWIQCSNNRTACPVFPGDTRITMLNVSKAPDVVIPKAALFEKLEKEAPDFLADVLRLEIPPTNDRLRIPVINTSDKRMAEQANRTMLEVFIDEKCHPAPGYVVPIALFFETFRDWLGPAERMSWSTKQKVSKYMPDKFPRGKVHGSSDWNYANISLSPTVEVRKEFHSRGDRLVTKDDE